MAPITPHASVPVGPPPAYVENAEDDENAIDIADNSIQHGDGGIEVISEAPEPPAAVYLAVADGSDVNPSPLASNNANEDLVLTPGGPNGHPGDVTIMVEGPTPPTAVYLADA